jgi:putative ABC transport system permease protein
LSDVLNLIGVIIGVECDYTDDERHRATAEIGAALVGMKRRQVLRMVLAEALALGLMGGVYGFVIGYFIAQVVILGTNMMAGYDLVYQFTPRPYLIGALIALVFVQAAAIYPARRAARVNIVEAIKHE